MLSKAERWQAGLEHIQQRRRDYTPEQIAYNEEIADKALAFFQFGPGRLLDVGCGTGWMRRKIPQCEYVGIDPIKPDEEFVFIQGSAEWMPCFDSGRFDNVLCYSVLQHSIDPPEVLEEIVRVLKPTGTAGLLIAVNDPNPIFIHQWTTNEALALVCHCVGSGESQLRILSTDLLHGRHLIIRAVR